MKERSSKSRLIEIIALCCLMTVLLFATGCNEAAKDTESTQPIIAEPMQTQTTTIQESVEVITPAIKEVSMIITESRFDPETITVNLNDLVRLNVYSKANDTMSLAITTFDVDELINPGEDLTIEFKADKKGTFELYCNHDCGKATDALKTEIIVN
ncbi:hypothetical protein HN587_07370 [Candidatus Woesearchaeota archaeon]|jgi:heme/copper-type cytochrome/quinol oxidase subunit 2|nr:hypothetical protein [Candidatus Woesearchaeota archaeon]